MANRYPPKQNGAKRILDYSLIRSLIEEGKQPAEIAQIVGTTRGNISKLKWMWRMVPNKWESVPEWY